MALIVQKYGGTSVGSAERIKNVARRVAKWKAAGHELVVVPSAMSGETNRLIALAKEMQPQPDPRELDVIGVHRRAGHHRPAGDGAAWSSGVKARSYTGAQVRILTDSAYTKARILDIDEQNIRARPRRRLRRRRRRLPGRRRRRATSPRSAAAARTPRAWRWPRRSRPTSARSTPTSTASTPPTRASCPRRGACKTITFEEMLEMASLGSKVLQIRSVEFAGKYRVRLRVLSSLTDPSFRSRRRRIGHADHFRGRREHGTGNHLRHRVQPRRGQDHDPGRARPARASPTRSSARSPTRNIDVDVIVQNVGHDGMTDFSFTVHRNDYQKALEILKRRSASTSRRARSSSDDTHRQGVGGRRGHALARRHRQRRCSARWPRRASTSR